MSCKPITYSSFNLILRDRSYKQFSFIITANRINHSIILLDRHVGRDTIDNFFKSINMLIEDLVLDRVFGVLVQIRVDYNITSREILELDFIE